MKPERSFDPDALDAAARQLELKLVVRFGSRAERSILPPAPDSDLDLALLAGDRHLSILEALDALAPVFPDEDLDLVILNGSDPLIRQEAMERGDLLWGDPDHYAEQQMLAYRMAADARPLRQLEAQLLRRKTDALLRRHAST